MITNDYPPCVFGGIGSHVDGLAESLSALGCDVTVVVGRMDRRDEPSISNQKSNLTVIRFAIEPRSGIPSGSVLWALKFNSANEQLLPALERYLRDQEPFDLIHAHDGFYALAAVAIKEQLNIPLVTTLHAIAAPRSHFRDAMRRFVLENSEGCITVSYWMRQALLKRYRLQIPVEVIHNGIEVATEPSKRPIRPSSTSPMLITFAGRLYEGKGCHILLQAMAHLVKTSRFDVRLQIIGDGPQRESLESMAVELGIDSLVDFHGYRAQPFLRKMMSRSVLAIIPSLNEPFGIVALEAMSEGAVVIASAVGGLQEIVCDRKNGALVPAGDPILLAAAMSDLLGNEELREHYRDEGFKTAAKYSWKKQGMRTIDFYNQILETARAKGTSSP